MGSILFGGTGAVNCHEYIKLNKKQENALGEFGLILFFLLTIIFCAINSFSIGSIYDPGLDSQTYTIEKAGFTITYPAGLSKIKESRLSKGGYSLYSFVKTKSVHVHVRPEWKPDDWTLQDFLDYATKSHRITFLNEVFDSTKVMTFSPEDSTGGSGSMSGRPSQDFPTYCDKIVATIRFSK